MSKTVISVENLSKRYDLGVIGTGTISRDLNRWWARLRGQPDPYARIGQADHGNRQGESIWALKDVSFEVKQGEVLGIIGRNGAGKSTLLKILSQVTAPTEGLVKVKGRIGSLLEVGTGFHPELTGRENVYLNGAILGMTRAEVDRKFDEIVDFSGVEKYIDTPVKRYSSGMYVRLAFAVAAHLDPEILIVDEVLAVGDIAFQKKCLGKMGAVAKEGRTVIFVSHNMAAVQALCVSGLVLKSGEVAYSGEIKDCVSAYIDKSNTTQQLTKIDFPANPDSSIFIRSLRVLNSSDEECSQFFHDEQVVIEAEILISKKVTGIYIAIHVHDENLNTLIFERDFEHNLDLLGGRDIGQYTYKISVPKSRLVPGYYSISFHIAQAAPARVLNGLDYACPFEIIDRASIQAQMGFPWRGRVRIPFLWDIQKKR